MSKRTRGALRAVRSAPCAVRSPKNALPRTAHGARRTRAQRAAWCLLAAAAMSFVSVPTAWSQTTRVAQVDVTGNEHINKEAILARISTKPGDEFSQAKLDQDVQTIHAMGF